MLGVVGRALGVAAPPLVCVQGMPSVAARRLLASLSQAGRTILYHGDFDAGGIRIGNILCREHAARPWRFSLADYERAIESAPVVSGGALGPVPDAVWDRDLSRSMREHGCAIHEEQVVTALLEDLRART